jgi:nitroreductase
MRAMDAIRARRSIKRFADRAVTRDEIEALLDAAALAPNHRLTQPWRFYVLGPEARYGYGLALGARKARKLPDPSNAEAVRELRERVAEEHRALPAMIAIAVVDDPKSADAELRDENYAAAMMAVENLSLAAVELGLGTHIKTGAIMADPAARAAVGVRDGERIVAIVNVGAPADVPPAKARESAAALTTWVP